MSRKQFDFFDRRKTEVLYSQLKHNLDTRVNGSVDLDFVSQTLLPSFKNADEALSEALRHPIEVTGDLQIVVGRNLAMLLKILLGEDDPKIPVEILVDVPNFDNLDEDDKLRLRTYAMSKDITKDIRRGLAENDLFHNISHYVEKGWTKEQVVEELSPLVKKWRIEKIFTKARTSWTQKQIAIGRQEAKVLREAGKPVNYDRICDRLGLPRTAAKDIQSPIRRGQTTMTVIQLKRKQNNLSKSRQYADENFLHYTLSESGTLAESDFPDKKPMSADTFIEITNYHLKQTQTVVALWQGALQRAHTQVQRLKHGGPPPPGLKLS